jgi:rubrerythrin
MKRRFFGIDSFPVVTTSAQSAAALVAVDPTGAKVPMHDPPLEPRDEAVFLLTAAAEIEHALMVQYLYAAYSLRVVESDPVFPKLKPLQDLLLQIAREEMGHLATVQNLLHLLGGPLNFNREHSPYASEIYPFRFKLEPLTLDSLAKYVVAESPIPLPADFPQADQELYEQIKVDARRSNDGRDVQHVGSIFARLDEIFAGGEQGVKDEDFRLDTATLQAKFADWGFEPKNPASGPPTGEKLIVESVEATDVAQVRAAVRGAVRAIGQQGEGFDLPPGAPGQTESHFERFFFQIYKPFKDLSADNSLPLTWPLAETPNTTTAPPPEDTKLRQMHMLDSIVESHDTKGRITNRRTRAWAHLFNFRYRNLLAYFAHFLRLNQQLYVVDSGPNQGNQTARGLLLIWTFNEMRRLKKIAGKLVQLPKDDPPSGVNAGPPFELPYSLNLPDREADRWRTHLDVSRAIVRLIRDELCFAGAPDERDGFLEDLLKLDEQAQTIMQSLAKDQTVPETSLPTNFKKVVLILEEAVRGFDIGAHKTFWDGVTRDRFIEGGFPLVPELVKKNDDGTFDFDPDKSKLIQRLEGTSGNRMPRFRPAVPESRIKFIRQWIQDRCPEDTSGESFNVHERNPLPEAAPTPQPQPTGPLSFAADIKGLFRAVPDREDMLVFGGFDLHKFEDVSDRAASILAVLLSGSMPCDGSWPPERIATFRKWIEDGKQP